MITVQSIKQQLQNKLVVISRNLGFNTGINANQISEYPFVVVHRADLQPVQTKGVIHGRFFIQIDVWGKQPNETSLISDELMNALLAPIELSNSSRLKIDLNASNVRSMDEIEPEIYRDILEIEFTQL